MLGEAPVLHRREWEGFLRRRQIEPPPEQEQGVAQRLGVEALAVELPIQGVVGVGREVVLAVGGRHAPGARTENATMQVLEGTAMAQEVAGEPVEQLRMAGRFTAQAEVAGCGHQAPAEVALPDPVDNDAGGQGIVRIGDPLRQLQATAGLRSDLGWKGLAAEDVGKLARHLRARPLGFAAKLQAGVAGTPLADRVGGRQHRPLFQMRGQGLASLAHAQEKPVERLLALALFGEGIGLFPGGVVARHRLALGKPRFKLGLESPGFTGKRREFGSDFRLRHQWHKVVLGLEQLQSGLRVARAGEDAVQPVIIAHADRIELVIVAACAAQGQTHDRATEVVERVLDRHMPGVALDE